MTHHVRISPTHVLAFPDSMSDEDISKAIYKNYPEYSKKQPEDSSSRLKNALKVLGQFGVGAVQSAAETGRSIGAASMGLGHAAFPLGSVIPKLELQKADVYGALGMQPTTASKLGQFAFDVAPIGVGAFKAASKAAKSIPRLAKYVSSEKLAQVIEKELPIQEKISTKRYKNLFKNTSHIKPTISTGTLDKLNELRKIKPGASEIKKPLKRFSKNPTLKNLHLFKSDLGKISQRLKNKQLKSGLEAAEIDKKNLVKSLSKSVERDLDKNMTRLSPDKFKEYLATQSNFRRNVVPFHAYPSLVKLLGEDRVVDSGLFRDLSKNAKNAKHLRRILGLSKLGLTAAKSVASPFFKYPLAKEIISGKILD